MKRFALIVIILLMTMMAAGQVTCLEGSRLEVRSSSDELIASNYFPGIIDAVCGYEIVAMWYDNDRVEVRDLKLNLLTSNYFTGIVGLSITAKSQAKRPKPLIIMYYNDRKVETRDERLTLISTRYR